MAQTLTSRGRIVKRVKFDVRFGAEIIKIERPSRSENTAQIVSKNRTWIDNLVGLFDDDPQYSQILENEKEARRVMDEEFTMPE